MPNRMYLGLAGSSCVGSPPRNAQPVQATTGVLQVRHQR
jgi:hypothetical protein